MHHLNLRITRRGWLITASSGLIVGLLTANLGLPGWGQ